jgi:hypothetical protein
MYEVPTDLSIFIPGKILDYYRNLLVYYSNVLDSKLRTGPKIGVIPGNWL